MEEPNNPLHQLLTLPESALLDAYRGSSMLTWKTQSPLFQSLARLFVPQNIPQILGRASHISVWFLNRARKLEIVPLSAERALPFFRAGKTLYGTLPQEAFPEVSQAYETGFALCDLLRIPRSDFRLSFFASCAGGRTVPHFDNADGFTLHISGKKRWGLAKNTTLQNPLTNHVIGNESNPPLRTITVGPMPTEMPADKQLVDLEPGTVLYIPRGMWHETWTEEDSISLDFNLAGQTNWKDLITSASERALGRFAPGRLTAHPQGDLSNFNDTLAEFKRLVASLSPADFFAPTEPRPRQATLCWNQLATWFIESQDDAHARVIFERSPSEDGTQAKLKHHWLALLAELDKGAPFTEADLLSRGIRQAEVNAVLDLLWSEGYIRLAG